MPTARSSKALGGDRAAVDFRREAAAQIEGEAPVGLPVGPPQCGRLFDRVRQMIGAEREQLRRGPVPREGLNVTGVV